MPTAPVIDAETDHSEPDVGPDYRQRDPLQIAMSLRMLMSRKEQLTVEFAERQYLAHVLAVDSHEGTFTFDNGNIEIDNEAMLESEGATFRSLPGAMHTHFTISTPRAVWFDDRPAFEAAFPDVLFYVQRREHFRVETPVDDPFIAMGADPGTGSFQLELQDLSLGGVALRTYEARFSGLEIGSVLHDVALQLGRYGSLSVNLEVVAPRLSTTDQGDVRYVISCRFLERSSVAERVLQRVILQLETARKELGAAR